VDLLERGDDDAVPNADERLVKADPPSERGVEGEERFARHHGDAGVGRLADHQQHRPPETDRLQDVGGRVDVVRDADRSRLRGRDRRDRERVAGAGEPLDDEVGVPVDDDAVREPARDRQDDRRRTPSEHRRLVRRPACEVSGAHRSDARRCARRGDGAP
jgi:hypothetical protein